MTMRKNVLFLLFSLAMCNSAFAQKYTQVWQKGKATTTELGEMTYSNAGQKVTVAGSEYATAEVDSITFCENMPAPRVISVSFSAGSVDVQCPDEYKDSISISVSGADAVIKNTKTGGEEFTINMKGESASGSIVYEGYYKCTFVLDGLNLTSSSKTNAPIEILCGKRVEMKLADGTVNSLTDAMNADIKAALYCKGHLELSGSGTLNITANSKHGISSKEYLQLKRSAGTINILKAANDAIHVGQYFQMNGGTINIDKNTAGDGIQAEFMYLDDDVTLDPEKEDNGKIFIKGGKINALIASQDCKAIKADGDIAISGGEITINANGNGSRGIQTDLNMEISEADANVPTLITIVAAGARCTLDECSNDPHRCMGIKLDGNLTVTGGVTKVTNTGSKSRGIKVGGKYTKTGGVVEATITQ